MKCDKNSLLLYAVTDRTWTRRQDLYEQVFLAIKGGATFVQFREKGEYTDKITEEALKIQKLCRENNIPFVINDRADIAANINADGVHIGQNDMSVECAKTLIGSDKIIGVSVQTVKQAVEAQEQGADYLGVGAVFPTSSKKDADFVSFDTLKKICAAVSIPVIAIGGINENNVLALSGSGICGIAVISAIFASDDIERKTSVLQKLTKRMIKND